MYIGRILLKGFKSFGGTHELLLPPGITAIVGPNGSGKSNILDALRWALGETNPSRLRILRQNDLLFHGSPSLPPSSSAEVLIQLRSAGAVCSIRRRWVQDEGSHLFVDGERVRLQDLEDVKRRWKLEGDRFAFIGQGEIAEVIQQRPAQRRAHLETLFGIDLYRKRREDAARRLEDASGEMVRLKTLKAELENRRGTIAPLVVQAQKAKEISERLEKEYRRLYWIKRTRAEGIIKAAQGEIDRLQGEHLNCRFWESGWTRKTESIEKTVPELESRLLELEENIDIAGKKLGAFQKEMFTLAASVREGRSQRLRLESDQKERDEILRKREKELEDAIRTVEEALRAEEEIIKEKKRLDDRQEALRLEASRILAKARDLEDRKSRAEAELGKIKARLFKSGSYFREMREILGENDRTAAMVRAELKKTIREKDRMESRLSDASRVHGDAYAACRENAWKLQALRRDIVKMEADVEELQDKLQSRTYPPPLRHLLAAKRLGRLKVELCPVVDAINCPDNLSRAIEAFLGGRQFWVLVEDYEAAGICIEHLKEAGAGRSTFLTLERASPRHPAGKLPLTSEGILGWAAEMLSFEKKWEPALLHILGDLLVVGNYEKAKDVARSKARFPVVTLEGEVINPSGTVTGGAKRSEPGALALGNEISRLKTDLEKARDMRERAIEQEISLGEAERRAAQKLEELEKELEQIVRKVGELEKTLARADRESERLKGEIEKASRELEAGGKAFFERVAEIRQIGKSLEELKVPDVDSKDMRKEQVNSRLELARERSRSARDIESRVRDECERLRRESQSTAKNISDTDDRIDTALQKLGELGVEYFEMKRTEWELSEKRARLKNSIKRLNASLEAARKRQDKASERLRSVKGLLSLAGQKKASAEAELSETLEMWEERYPYMGPESVDVTKLDSVKRCVRELEAELRALGEVDMGVLSEDKSLKERLEFLSRQLEDVGCAMKDLKRFILETDEQAGKLFSESLKRIEKSFSSLFQRLFGGGEAELRLSDGEDPWNAGVEVMARPPGKRPQHLGQLSGGEQSLAAISLLFASMEVAQVPLGILDEVDAALDEVNLRRFSDLAREYSSRMQLVCMTHRRVTMERADVMYGVTLSEPGLSQLVSVKLEDWD